MKFKRQKFLKTLEGIIKDVIKKNSRDKEKTKNAFGVLEYLVLRK